MTVNIEWIRKVCLKVLISYFLILDVKTVLSRCSIKKIENGSYKPRIKVVRYSCNPGYELFGERTLTCRKGNFDFLPPVCIKPGCVKLSNPRNGMTNYMRKNALALFFCNPGFVLQGEQFAYCNGVSWIMKGDPYCSASMQDIETSCDFETENMCGWVHDPKHDFSWQRQNRFTPSFHVRTGPSYDHTFGDGNDGYYMYIEGDAAKENNTARLLSPLYPPSLSKNGCFSFYYHMYGKYIGTLRVYVLPESITFSEMMGIEFGTDKEFDIKKKYMLFEKKGNQGNYWYNGFFELDELSENFQIVIEGVRGSGVISDIAIDDVAILQNEQCVEQKTQYQSATEFSVIIKESCINRCDTNSTEDCQCNIECLDKGTCCVDYREFCIFGNSTDSSIQDLTKTYIDEGEKSTPIPNFSILEHKTTETIEILNTTLKTTITTPKIITTITTTKPPITTSKVISTTPKTTITTPKTTITTPKLITTTPKTTIMTTKTPTTSKVVTTTPKATIKTTKPTTTTPKYYNKNSTNTTIATPKTTRTTKITTTTPKIITSTFKTTKIATTPKVFPVTEYVKHYIKSNYTTTNKNIDNKLTSTTKQPNVYILTTSKKLSNFSNFKNTEILYNTTMQFNLDKNSEKHMDKYIEDAHEPDSPSNEVISKGSTTAVCLTIIIVIVIVVSGSVIHVKKIYLNFPYRYSTIWRLRRFHNSSNASSSDIRFLVQDEELEHEY